MLKSRTINFPLALSLGIVSIMLCGASIFLPWWRVHDNRVGTTWSILLILMRKTNPSYSLEYIWSILDLGLRNTLSGALVLIIAGLMFNLIGFKLRGLNIRVILLQRRVRLSLPAFFHLLSGLGSFAAYLLFRISISSYLESVGQSFSGSKGVLHWGLGIGANFILAGGVLVCIGGILYLLKAETVGVEIIIETEEVNSNIGEEIN